MKTGAFSAALICAAKISRKHGASAGFAYLGFEEIAGGSAGFPDDGLHYDDKTPANFCRYICAAKGRCF